MYWLPPDFLARYIAVSASRHSNGRISAVVRVNGDAQAGSEIDVDAVVTIWLVQPSEYVRRDALGIF